MEMLYAQMRACVERDTGRMFNKSSLPFGYEYWGWRDGVWGYYPPWRTDEKQPEPS